MKDLEMGEQKVWRGRRGCTSVGLIVREAEEGQIVSIRALGRANQRPRKIEKSGGIVAPRSRAGTSEPRV